MKKPKIKKEKIVEVLPEVELISFTISATIPVMPYANIIPAITVKAKTIDDARKVVLPVIEELFNTYCEDSRDGITPKFMSKAKVTVKETVAVQEKSKDVVVKSGSPAFVKAANAINGAVSKEALDLIEEQIKKSIKLTAEEKPELYTLILIKRKTYENIGNSGGQESA